MASLSTIDPRLRAEPGAKSSRPSAALSPIATPQNQHQGPSSSHRTAEPSQPATNAPSPLFHHTGFPANSQSPHFHPPHTPHSAGATTDDGNTYPPKSSRQPRACNACRGLKVRCQADENNPDANAPCKRCAKAHRDCITDVPTRKRQKKADSRVAELEKKIDEMQAAMHASPSGFQAFTHGGGHGMNQAPSNPQSNNVAYEQVTNGSYGGHASSMDRPEARPTSGGFSGYSKTPNMSYGEPSAPMVMAGQKRNYDGISTGPKSSFHGDVSAKSSEDFDRKNGLGDSQSKSAFTSEYTDVVDRGVVSTDSATKMFECYLEEMAIHMPAVVFPPGTTAAEARKTKPTLFLAILSAASGSNRPEIQKILTKEVMSIYAERIICKGEKTLELVQALLVSSLWYWPPEHFEELKFYQLIHIAAVMAIDIGMGNKAPTQKFKDLRGLWRDHPWRRTPYPNSESIEARRTWLACYFLCCNASMGLRRPNLIRWTQFIADSVEVLESSPEAYPSDKIMALWVRSQHIAEEVGTQFSMDDPTANISIADPKIQFALKGFERELEKWSSELPSAARTPSLEMTGHVINLYMHEVAMHVDHDVDKFKPPFTEDSLEGAGKAPDVLNPAHISALSTCLTSIDGIFNTFLSLDVTAIRCLPIMNFVRVAYAVVVLIKMYFAAATPNSELGKVINKDNMKVEQYLDGLVDLFSASAAQQKSRPAAKFLMVLLMLKTWFHRQSEGKLSPSAVTEAAAVAIGDASDKTLKESQQSNSRPAAPQHNGQANLSPANTYLQLLSEVATGSSQAPLSDKQYGGILNEWSNGYGVPTNQMSSMLPQGYDSGSGSSDPSFGLELGFTIGDGFEQAMGMTLGFGDYGNYFSNGDFFGTPMDPSNGGAGAGFGS